MALNQYYATKDIKDTATAENRVQGYFQGIRIYIN